jgi:peptidoglycan/LPS O-acetylase OafA/YrhL
MVVAFHSLFYAQADFHQMQGTSKALFSAFAYLWIGVPIFFVISGYCISATCDSMRRHTHSVRSYLWRRYWRIFPPFWACLALTAVVLSISHNSAVFTEPTHRAFGNALRPGFPAVSSLSVSQWIGNVTLSESWRHNFGGNPRLYLLGQAWSLCYEEQFYIVCGFLLFIAPAKFFRNAAYIAAAVGAVAIVSPHNYVEGFFFDGRWLTFALGILVYWTLNYASEQTASRLKGFGMLVTVTAAGGLVARSIRIYVLSDQFRTELLCAVMFTTALLYLRPHDGRIMQSTLLRPITWCGAMCYSLYLCHWIVVKPLSTWFWHHGLTSAVATTLVTLPICVLASIAVSRLFYLAVERHFLNKPSGTEARIKDFNRNQLTTSSRAVPSAR